MSGNSAEINLLFETSWEVCNKVGGIYTVLSTKAKKLQSLYKDKVIFVGPDIWSDDNPCPCFSESRTLLKRWREQAKLPKGVNVRVGRWLVPGRPIAVLVSFEGMYAVKDAFYGWMWNEYGVDSLHAYGDYDEACAFSHAAGIVIESIALHLMPEHQEGIVAHFNEWTTGMGLLYVRSQLPQAATVFTTHATSIGRSICGNGKDLYRYFTGYDGDQMARELNMESKHSLEKVAAHNADCFTTVSQLTADECAQLLGRRPDIVTPNGFEENFVPKPRTLRTARSDSRAYLLKVAGALTGRRFDDNTFIIGTSGRCEYRNKGLDVFIDSVKLLAEQNTERDTVAFVMVPAWSAGARDDLKHNLSLKRPDTLPEAFVTHNLHNFNDDAVVRHIKGAGFDNRPDRHVFIIYVPCYLNGNDGIFNKTYYDLLPGMDATVFASYYEPWGYTPLESIAFGVPTVTTTLSGFGKWILSHFSDSLAETGVRVIERNDENYHDACRNIADSLRSIETLSEENMSGLREAARHTAQNITWETFVNYYIDAFDIALRNADERFSRYCRSTRRIDNLLNSI